MLTVATFYMPYAMELTYDETVVSIVSPLDMRLTCFDGPQPIEKLY